MGLWAWYRRRGWFLRIVLAGLLGFAGIAGVYVAVRLAQYPAEASRPLERFLPPDTVVAFRIRDLAGWRAGPGLPDLLGGLQRKFGTSGPLQDMTVEALDRPDISSWGDLDRRWRQVPSRIRGLMTPETLDRAIGREVVVGIGIDAAGRPRWILATRVGRSDFLLLPFIRIAIPRLLPAASVVVGAAGAFALEGDGAGTVTFGIDSDALWATGQADWAAGAPFASGGRPADPFAGAGDGRLAVAWRFGPETGGSAGALQGLLRSAPGNLAAHPFVLAELQEGAIGFDPTPAALTIRGAIHRASSGTGVAVKAGDAGGGATALTDLAPGGAWFARTAAGSPEAMWNLATTFLGADDPAGRKSDLDTPAGLLTATVRAVRKEGRDRAVLDRLAPRSMVLGLAVESRHRARQGRLFPAFVVVLEAAGDGAEAMSALESAVRSAAGTALPDWTMKETTIEGYPARILTVEHHPWKDMIEPALVRIDRFLLLATTPAAAALAAKARLGSLPRISPPVPDPPGAGRDPAMSAHFDPESFRRLMDSFAVWLAARIDEQVGDPPAAIRARLKARNPRYPGEGGGEYEERVDRMVTEEMDRSRGDVEQRIRALAGLTEGVRWISLRVEETETGVCEVSGAMTFENQGDRTRK